VPSLKGGIGVEPEREANRFAVPFGDFAKRFRFGRKEIAGEVGLIGLYLVQ
jgi:hypothetical protein